MEDVHNIDHELELNNKKFRQSEHVSPENKQAVQKFVDKCFAQGLGKARVRKYISNFHTILKMAPDGFVLWDSEQEEIEKLVAKIEKTDYAEPTKSDFKLALKKFYKVMEGNGREYPEKAKFINTNRDKTKIDNPYPLDKEQINAIIDACKNDRDRAMYKVLYEAGLRAGELMSLRIRDVNFTEHGVKLNVRGKTGNRKILVVESERYLRNWLSKHPFPDRRDAPLWVKVDGKNIDTHTPEDMELGYDYMRINLKRKAAAAGVRVTTKANGRKSSEVYPHLFRHTRATHLATEMTEAAMCQYFGWTQGSDMPQTYIHLSGRDIDKEILQMYGIEEKEENGKRECQRCYKVYKGSDNFCPRCGAPLDQKAAQQAEEGRQLTDVLAQAVLKGDADREKLRALAEELSGM